ncbi:MAG: redox-regulated ATPase YchF [Oscillospiraceae bacterium]|nr:redox-regulated ATPase YchF [Oscillospiraceae bacterium]
MKLGIVGLTNVGKSTLFNAVTGTAAASSNCPFSTVESNVGSVPVPDPRLDTLAEMYNPAKITPAVIELVDIAGLVRGASAGKGLGNKFLNSIREVDAIIHVVRCFESDDIIHVDGSVDPLRDIETTNLELICADAEILGRRIDRAAKALKGDRSAAGELEVLKAVMAQFDDGLTARSMGLSPDDIAILSDSNLLTLKPVIYAANLSEADFAGKHGIAGNSVIEENRHYKAVRAFAASEGSEILPVCAQMEADIAELDAEEKALFLSELGLEASGLDRLIQAGYRLLGLISFLTAGPKEVRAWTITEGTKAPEAAGKIHSDLKRGFIRAEVVAFTDLTAHGSMAAAKERGLVRSEGKEYVVKDGDVVLFRFNV